ncbi:MAG TPA: aspartate kinase [Ignavibacteriaceae bacterium]|nr:aspartate kinase [Ignavibacteriaceae bacterium]
MAVIVQKYGGSSVADTTKLKVIANNLSKRIKEGNKLVVVVSAMGKTTDNLIRTAKEITENIVPRELDMLLTTGEQVTAALLSIALNDIEIKSKSLNAFQLEILTTNDFNAARIRNLKAEKLKTLLNNFDAIIVTGFQGITEEGDITTLGRGGSDTSAVALAAAMDANCEIYSDVAGIYSADPRIHPTAKKLKYVAYDEMLEMSSLGAKVLHSRSVEIAKKFNIKLYCGSTFSDEEGSYVVDDYLEQPSVTGVSSMDKQTQVTISKLPLDYTIVHDIFKSVANHNLNVDMISVISNTTLNVSFTIIEDEKHHFQKALSEVLQDLPKLNIKYNSGYSKVSIVGIGMKSSSGVAAKYFDALKNIPVKLVTTSEIKISCLVEESYKDRAIKELIKMFEL